VSGPAVANRAGQIQGGALFDGAAAAAERALAAPSAVLVDGHYQFLRPARARIVAVNGRVLRRGRRVAFVETQVAGDGQLVGLGRFGFRV
jgi:acyl-coenzyme A thioesterase PaaI-like protein